MSPPPDTPPHVLMALETVLLTHAEPLKLTELVSIFSEDHLSATSLRSALLVLQHQWAHRGMVLVETALGWRFQSKPALAAYLRPAHAQRLHRFSRAAVETLAIIAYKQPVCRADIEDIRGVAVSANILKSLEDKGWIKEVGHKNAPGRPALFATTATFLADFGLSSLSDLPTTAQDEAPPANGASPVDG